MALVKESGQLLVVAPLHAQRIRNLFIFSGCTIEKRLYSHRENIEQRRTEKKMAPPSLSSSLIIKSRVFLLSGFFIVSSLFPNRWIDAFKLKVYEREVTPSTTVFLVFILHISCLLWCARSSVLVQRSHLSHRLCLPLFRLLTLKMQ